MARTPKLKDSFNFYYEWIHSMEAAGLSGAQFRQIVMAAVNYSEFGIVPTEDDLDPASRMMFTVMQTRMDEDARAHEAKAESARRAAKEGVRKRAQRAGADRQN